MFSRALSHRHFASRVRTRAYVENGLGTLVNPVELKKFGYEEYLSPGSSCAVKTPDVFELEAGAWK